LYDRSAQLWDAVRGISTHGGVLLYDVTIDEDGSVREVRLLKPVDSAPPWPEIDRAWRDTIAEWRYAPTLVNGQPTRLCMTVSVIIDVS
jgi:TonB family protein